jgi:small-conductance mechanosensitive channel
MSITQNYLASDNEWHDFWQGEVGHWLLTKGLHILLLIVFAAVATRLIRWAANRISNSLASIDDPDSVVRSESVKHRQAVASVISSVVIAVLYAIVTVDVCDQLGLPLGSLVAPAAVLGAALGFGAQRIVQDLLSGFFLITERQYGFGDLVELSVNSAGTARGTVEDVTLRVTKLRTADGEMFTVPNGQIMKALNLSKDWARAVVDIPVPKSADLNEVNEVLRQVATDATHQDGLPDLLLDEPQVMGVDSIGVDTVNVRMVARTLPGKQFEVGRELRALVVSGLRNVGVSTQGGNAPTVVGVGADANSN